MIANKSLSMTLSMTVTTVALSLSVDILTNGMAVDSTVLQLLRTCLFIRNSQGYSLEDAW